MKSFELTNYHTHTFRCIHAGQVPDEDYVLAAIESGYKVLGFSDHSPWPYESYVSNIRMPVSQLRDYIDSVRALQEKYKGTIEITLGLECEYFPKYLGWLEPVMHELDYVILGNHFGLTDENGAKYYGFATQPEQLEEYTRYTLEGMRTGLFRYLAHPELPLADYPEFDETAQACFRKICEEAKKLDIVLEYNMYGAVKKEAGKTGGIGYPAEQFWKIAAECGCRAIVGVDAHSPTALRNTEKIAAAQEFLDSTGLEVVSYFR